MDGDCIEDMCVNKKDIVLLGMRDEVLSIDFAYTDEQEIELMMAFVHKIAYQELMSRPVLEMEEWSLRTKHLFIHNHIDVVEYVVLMTKHGINNLIGCGYKTRKEIYDVFKTYGFEMPNWFPGLHYERKNYIFEDEMEIER